MDELREAILQAIQANSGGMKYTALATQLVSKLYRQNRTRSPDLDRIDEVLKALQEEGVIGILEYTWHMSPDVQREKQFIYTP